MRFRCCKCCLHGRRRTEFRRVPFPSCEPPHNPWQYVQHIYLFDVLQQSENWALESQGFTKDKHSNFYWHQSPWLCIACRVFTIWYFLCYFDSYDINSICLSVCKYTFVYITAMYAKALDISGILSLSKIKIQVHSWSLCTFAFVITVMLFKKGIW